MTRRGFLKDASRRALAAASVAKMAGGQPRLEIRDQARSLVDAATAKNWLAQWERYILSQSRSRSCDREMGEELGWLVSPFLIGFYYGFLATGERNWVEMLVDWTDSCIKRAVGEPDGFIGWPKGGTGGRFAEDLYADSMLGEAMILRPIVLMASEIIGNTSLNRKWGGKAHGYLELAEQIYQKWEARDCWRESKVGGLWLLPPFGVDRSTGQWTEGYERRKTDGFSFPDNKENEIARWLIAMFDVTKKPVYRERSEAWWQLMRSRIKTREDGKYWVWNYWEPAGPWDYNPSGSTKLWVGVHPNGAYYMMDVTAMVTAFEHQLVFRQEDLDHLIATNRDFMWNHKLHGAAFQAIDGAQADLRRKPFGLLWPALVPYDKTLREIFIANLQPASWGGLGSTPWFLSLRTSKASEGRG